MGVDTWYDIGAEGESEKEGPRVIVAAVDEVYNTENNHRGENDDGDDSDDNGYVHYDDYT